MSDSPSLDEISALLDSLSGTATEETEPTRPRFIVATDWSSAAAPLALLRAYVTIFEADAAVRLCFAVPHEPTDTDVVCVRELVNGVGAERDVAELELRSFEDLLDTDYDSGVVSQGDSELLLTEVAGLILRMHDVARTQASGSSGQASWNVGSRRALRDRLSRFQP